MANLLAKNGNGDNWYFKGQGAGSNGDPFQHFSILESGNCYQAGQWTIGLTGALPAGAAVIGAVTQSGPWSVSVSGSLPAGTAAIGKLAANDGVDIGDVTLTAGSATVGAVNQAGNWMVGVSGSLPAGTAAIGKLAANDGVDIGDATINNAADNGVYIRPGTGINLNTSAVTVSAALPAGANTIGAVNQAGAWGVAISGFNGTAPDTNSGNKSAGTLRVVLATDQPSPTNPFPASQSGPWGVAVSGFNGTAPDTNSGNKSAGTLRVVLATDQPTLSNAQPVTPQAGELHLGEVGTPCTVLTVIPTVSTSPAYASGDCVGGRQTLTGAVRVSQGTSVLQSLTLTDNANQKAALTILFFRANPVAATITDNTGFAWSTDLDQFIGKVNVQSTDYESWNSKAVASLRNLGLELKASGTDLYAAVITPATPTYAGTTDLSFKYGFLQS